MPQLFEDVAESDEDSEEELQDKYKEAQGDVEAEGSDKEELSGQEGVHSASKMSCRGSSDKVEDLQETRQKWFDPKGTQ